MGSSSSSYSSGRVVNRPISGTETYQATGGAGIADILPDDSEDSIIIALVNITAALYQQSVGTPVTVHNWRVFASGQRIGDIPSVRRKIAKDCTHGHIHNVEQGLVCLYR